MQLGAKDIEEDKDGEVAHDVDQGASLKQVYASFAQWRHSGRSRPRERKRPRHPRGEEQGGKRRGGGENGDR